jgi:hypothetical protein
MPIHLTKWGYRISNVDIFVWPITAESFVKLLHGMHGFLFRPR